MKKNQILSLVVVWALLFWVTSATSSYIHEQNGTISICDPDSNWTKCITMQDKNLWATKVWTWCSSSDTWACGNHYQRWNNHGFLPCLDSNWCNTFPWWESTWATHEPNCANYWPLNLGYTSGRYDSSTFISNNSDWCNPRNDNLRWWENDSQANNRWFDTSTNAVIDAENRRWPCGEWYHVPSIWERWILLKYWAANYTWAWNTLNLIYSSGLPGFSSNATAAGQFQEDFKIPFAGYRYYGAKVYGVGDYTFPWSSSPDAGNEYARYFNLDPNNANVYYNLHRASAFSVRCFKNSYLSFPSSEGGEPQVIVNIAEFNWWQNTCSGSNYIFENIVAWTSTGTHTLSWVFQCAFWNGRSSSIVTLQLSGNLVADGDRVISGSNLMMKNSEWTVSPVWLKFADTLISTWRALTATQTLFQKTANLIWVASWVVEVQLTVPWWTPDGTYNWTLVLTY